MSLSLSSVLVVYWHYVNEYDYSYYNYHPSRSIGITIIVRSSLLLIISSIIVICTNTNMIIVGRILLLLQHTADIRAPHTFHCKLLKICHLPLC